MSDSTGKKKVRITYAAIGGGSIPVWTAKEMGFYERNGLDAEVFMTKGSGNCTDALLKGDAHFGNYASPAMLKASLEGNRDLVYLTGGINYMVQTVVVQPEITSGAQLKGKRMGRSGDGTNLDDVLMEEIAPRLGIDPEKDLIHVPIKNQPDALGMMERREIDSCLFTPPWLFAAKNKGFKILVDALEIKLDCQLGGIIATKDLVASDPDLCRRVVKSYMEGVHHFRSNPEFCVGLQKKYSNVHDRAVALECHAVYSKYFKQRPYASAKGIKTVLNAMAHTMPEAAQVDPERFIDRRFIKELDDSGFIDQLYKGEPRDPE
jgi:ABC-type nitrate/sulfonate/bicarbonate transport system substrate-binding protein